MKKRLTGRRYALVVAGVVAAMSIGASSPALADTGATAPTTDEAGQEVRFGPT